MTPRQTIELALLTQSNIKALEYKDAYERVAYCMSTYDAVKIIKSLPDADFTVIPKAPPPGPLIEFIYAHKHQDPLVCHFSVQSDDVNKESIELDAAYIRGADVLWLLDEDRIERITDAAKASFLYAARLHGEDAGQQRAADREVV